jgi:hypothetical protein
MQVEVQAQEWQHCIRYYVIRMDGPCASTSQVRQKHLLMEIKACSQHVLDANEVNQCTGNCI